MPHPVLWIFTYPFSKYVEFAERLLEGGRGSRTSEGRGVGDGAFLLGCQVFHGRCGFCANLLVGVINLNLNLLLVITDNVH